MHENQKADARARRPKPAVAQRRPAYAIPCGQSPTRSPYDGSARLGLLKRPHETYAAGYEPTRAASTAQDDSHRAIRLTPRVRPCCSEGNRHAARQAFPAKRPSLEAGGGHAAVFVNAFLYRLRHLPRRFHDMAENYNATAPAEHGEITRKPREAVALSSFPDGLALFSEGHLALVGVFACARDALVFLDDVPAFGWMHD